jgi:hypothetical protein
VQIGPPWGDYFGVVSQSVATSAAATEVEVTVSANPQLLEKVRQGNTEWDSMQQLVLYTLQQKQLYNGENRIQLYGAPVHISSTVQVSVRVFVYACESENVGHG